MEEVKKYYYTIMILVIFIILLIIGIFISNKYVKNNKVIDKYIFDGNIDYSVIQKDKTVSNQKLFVSSLVDKINIDFNYKYTHDNKDIMNYRYEVVATVVSNLDDINASITEVYKKDKILLNNSGSTDGDININEKIIINYDEYNKLAIDYDESVNIPIKSKLVISLNLYINNKENDVLSSSLSIPLEQPTFSIGTNLGNTKGNIISESNNNSKIIINVVIICLILLSFIYLVINVIKILNYKKNHILEFKYRKIMSDYNNIVVPINALPKDNDIVVIKVLYFKSMIDIQKELHIPILCYKSDNMIVYMIINNKLAYIYFLNNNEEKI